MKSHLMLAGLMLLATALAPAVGQAPAQLLPTWSTPTRPAIVAPVEPLPIDAPECVDTGELVIVSATVTGNTAWTLIPQRAFMRGEGGKQIAFSSGKNAGPIVVILATVNGDMPRLYQRTIQVGKAEPPTPPTPPPNPPLPPNAKAAWAVVIRESGEQTPDQAKIFYSDQLRTILPHPLQVVDKDVAQGAFAPFAALARSGGKLPWLVLTAEDGTIVWQGPLPATLDETVAILKQHGGRP